MATGTGLRAIYGARSDAGQRRANNEDAIYAAALPANGTAETARILLSVADGVGGHQRGEWASQQAIATLVATLPERLAEAEPATALPAAFAAANAAVWQGREAGPAAAATTLVAALVEGDRLWWAHVGDSRAYLVRDGAARRLTRDHSWIEEQVGRGALTLEEAQQSEHRHVILRSIGSEPEVAVDVGGPLQLEAGDVLILCSDGLYEPVGEADMAAVASALAPEWAAQRLIDLGNERGGPDNLSAVVCACHDVSALAETGEHGQPDAPPRPSRRRRVALALLIALVIAAGALAATLALSSWPLDPIGWLFAFITPEELARWQRKLS